jgi:hypothetical protein
LNLTLLDYLCRLENEVFNICSDIECWLDLTFLIICYILRVMILDFCFLHSKFLVISQRIDVRWLWLYVIFFGVQSMRTCVVSTLLCRGSWEYKRNILIFFLLLWCFSYLHTWTYSQRIICSDDLLSSKP